MIADGQRGRQSPNTRAGAVTMPVLRRIVAGAVMLVLAAVALSPMGCYISRAAFEEARILSRRQPINRLVADSAVRNKANINEATRAKLALVLDARAFARDSLGLKTGKSFTSFAQLDRDTLVLVLSAAYRDRLERRTWWFPVVGRFPYKGFFNFPEAVRTADQMRRDGFDVTLGASSAFSTLGWFNDPLVSTTLAQDSLILVNTVIHELLHNTFFAKGKVPFNESFASFVGGRGAEAFFRARGDSAGVRRAEVDWQDDIILGGFWARLSRNIEQAFAALPRDSTAARLAARERIYSAARRELVDSIGPLLRTYPPGWTQRVTLNNAVLLSRRVYAEGLDQFDAVYVHEGRDLKKAIARVAALAKASPDDPQSAIGQWLKASASP